MPGFGNIDLILTGRFSQSLYPYSTGKNRFLFAYSVPYGKELIQKYGMDIMGLNQDKFNNLEINVYLPEYIREIKKQLGQ